MKKPRLITTLGLFICFMPFLTGQTKLVHISDLEDESLYGKYADVEGFILVEQGTSLPVNTRFMENPFDIVSGFPVSVNGSSSRGGVYAYLVDDGDFEIVYNAGNYTHAIQADGTPVEGWPVYVGSSAEYSAPAYCEVNGDYQWDIVVSTRQPGTGNSGKVHAFNKDGSYLPGFPVTCDGGPTRTPVLANLDGGSVWEGTQIIVELRKYPDGFVCIYNGDGSIRDGWPQAMDYIPGSTVAVGDITGDDLPEIVAESYYKVWAWDTEGNVLDGFPYEPGNGRVFSYSTPVLADVDGDGFREIIVGDHSSASGNGAVHIIKNDGTSLNGWPKFTTYWIYGPPSVADIDGDGDLDVAVGDQVLSPTPVNKVYAWDIYEGYLEGFPIGPIDAINSQILIADIDGDDMVELIFDDNTGNGILNGYNHDGTLMEGWPLEVEGSSFFTNPILFDITSSFEQLNLTATSYDSGSQKTFIYLWETDVPYNHTKSPLTILQYNTRHSGVSDDINNPALSLPEHDATIPISVTVSPNPCKDETVLRFSSAQYKTADIRIFNEFGILVREIDQYEGSSLTLNVSGFDTGIYFVSVNEDSGRSAMTKFIKVE
jgi:hypothetical protein